jgi:DNA replicative helicase MCM subunit Mcm2 (Cdc46/Mcm family)
MSKSDVCDGIKQSEFENNSIQSPEGKKCVQCGAMKDLYDYYSKGNRRDSICKVCVLDKKKRCRKKKRQVRERRKATKVLDVQSLMIQDVVIEKPETSLENFDTTLTNYVLDVVIAFKSEGPNE